MFFIASGIQRLSIHVKSKVAGYRVKPGMAAWPPLLTRPRETGIFRAIPILKTTTRRLRRIVITTREDSSMNENLIKAIKAYSTRSHAEYLTEMSGLSKDNLLGVFSDLLTQYINDKNSSTLREFITVTLAGYDHRESKIGVNGFKHTTAGELTGRVTT